MKSIMEQISGRMKEAFSAAGYDPKYGDVVMLKYYCDLSVNEIAQQLELTPENVKVRLHRARALLKTKLEGAGIIEGS